MHIIFHDWGKNYFCFSSDLLVVFRMLDAPIILPLQHSIILPSELYPWYVFCPLTLLLSCRLHPHCFSFLESRKKRKKRESEMDHKLSVGFHAWCESLWDTKLLKDSFSLHCAIIGSFHSGELHDCDQPVRVHGLWQSLCVPEVAFVRQNCQDCQSTFTYHCARQPGAEGREQAFRCHGRQVWCCWVCAWCLAPGTCCFWDIPFICCKSHQNQTYLVSHQNQTYLVHISYIYARICMFKQRIYFVVIVHTVYIPGIYIIYFRICKFIWIYFVVPIHTVYIPGI